MSRPVVIKNHKSNLDLSQIFSAQSINKVSNMIKAVKSSTMSLKFQINASIINNKSLDWN